ncbi:GlsB/YeaQ/YmgE family stress response membrane protein [Sphingomonas quercus]|uniref:GlsB/YeaQ/YmgE family stress response membrane protein n=1 Tax=Sphingomonas quercus TaxID=2842451 RepID=A0ABS6BKT6_9SPHN|nr:GlsB/YeaQ/YmgE family stress response membrane protein [Sphingomonas quercus]MBU3078036.1 GlsB/YeaQ/YmgE family stress response membrane protein [Sphingomonas quercus]
MERALLAWIAIGIVIGVAAHRLLFKRNPGGLIVTVLLGMAGALFAGFLGRVTELYAPGRPASLSVAAAGALATLLAYRAILRRRS